LATVPQLRPWRAREPSRAKKNGSAERSPAAPAATPAMPAPAAKPAPAATPAPVMGAPVEAPIPGWGDADGWGRYGQKDPAGDGNGAAPDGHAGLPSFDGFSVPPRSRRRLAVLPRGLRFPGGLRPNAVNLGHCAWQGPAA